MVLNKWLSIFMPYLRRFCCNDDMAFIDNEILKEFGIACSNVYVFHKDNDKEYFASDFEKCLSNLWAYGPCENWTRIEIYVYDVFWDLQEGRCLGGLVLLITATSHVSVIPCHAIQRLV